MSKVLLEKWAKITLYEARKVEVETDTHLHTVKKEHNYRILRGHLLPLFYGGGIQKNQGCHFIVYQWEYYQKQYNNKGFHHHLMLMPRFFYSLQKNIIKERTYILLFMTIFLIAYRPFLPFLIASQMQKKMSFLNGLKRIAAHLGALIKCTSDNLGTYEHFVYFYRGGQLLILCSIMRQYIMW